MSHRNLIDGFLESAARWPDRDALRVDGAAVSYADLRTHVQSLAATLAQHGSAAEVPHTAILASRSRTAYAGVLAALMRGHAYVPLNPGFPPARLNKLLQRSSCRSIVVDAGGEKVLDGTLEGVDRDLVLLFPDREDVTELAQRHPRHRVLGRADCVAGEGHAPVARDPDDGAYLLFTSGSTGEPKGCVVSHHNVTSFLDAVQERYGFTPEDRFSQMFDLSFDLSVFDLFASWGVGACLCCPSKMDLLTPGRYVQEEGITVWFSVPSLGMLMQKLGQLGTGEYPGLRLSLFCGEALTVELAEGWAAAAPNSDVENLYGPTELTIACTLYRWDRERSMAESRHGVVPIGTPFPDMRVLVADENYYEVAPGELGELLMDGPQRTAGYLEDPERTSDAYVNPPGLSGTFYRTGDLVLRPASDDEPLRYEGRLDHQIKIHGMRVELGEIEAVLREESGLAQVAAVGWPVTSAGADGIVAFVAGDCDASALKTRIKERLPPWMAPRRIDVLPEFPLNPNGKIDRKALLERLQRRTATG